jgi:TetR/AcrR family transcriptional repressor of mexJK operon
MNRTVRTGHHRGQVDSVKLPSAPSSRSEDKRLRILAAAREVFVQHGFQAASMDLVAAAAGVSKVTIYSKFGSKHELFSAIVDDICEQILAMEMIVPEAVESTYEGLAELAVCYASVLFDPEVLALARLAIGENHNQKYIGRLYYQAGPARARAGLADLLRAMSDSGDLAIDDPELAADQFVALLQPRRYYALLDPAASPPAEEIERIARAGVEVFLSYYAMQPRD